MRSKAVIALLTFSYCGVLCFANDSQFVIQGGEIVPIEPNSSPIRLLNENLSFAFGKDTFDVDVEYTFVSPDSDIEIDVAFPILVEGVNNGTARIKDEPNNLIRNFKTVIDGEALSVKEKVDAPVLKIEPAHFTKTVRIWYLSTLRFTNKKETKVRVSYTSDYSRGGLGYKWASYLYGTGNTWKNGIEKFNLSLRTSNEEFIVRSDAPFLKKANRQRVVQRWVSPTETLLSIDNLRPETNDTIQIAINEFGWIDLIGGDFEWQSQYGKSGKPNFSLDVSMLTREQLRIVRNAFYAKWNYAFKSSDLIEYFQKNMHGYSPTVLNVDQNLSQIQKSAMATISAEEAARLTY